MTSADWRAMAQERDFKAAIGVAACDNLPRLRAELNKAYIARAVINGLVKKAQREHVTETITMPDGTKRLIVGKAIQGSPQAKVFVDGEEMKNDY